MKKLGWVISTLIMMVFFISSGMGQTEGVAEDEILAVSEAMSSDHILKYGVGAEGTPVHEHIVSEALNLWPPEDHPAYSEFMAQKENIRRGAGEEDTRASGCNPLFHFWDPDNGYDDGLLTSPNRSAISWAQEVFNEAIKYYENGDINNAYYSLGRVVHLLCDMSVPAHVHLDEHLSNSESFEQWTSSRDSNQKMNAEYYTASNLQNKSLISIGSLSFSPGSYIYSSLPTTQKNDLFKLFVNLAELGDNFDSEHYLGEATHHYNGISWKIDNLSQIVSRIQVTNTDVPNVVGTVPSVGWGMKEIKNSSGAIIEKRLVIRSTYMKNLGPGHFKFEIYNINNNLILTVNATITKNTDNTYSIRSSVLIKKDISDNDCKTMGDQLIPLAIRYSATLLKTFFDSAPPIVNMNINNDSSSTTYKTVTLNNTIKYGSANYYRASEREDFSDASWKSYSAAPNFFLSPSSGSQIKTVYFQVRRGSILSKPVSDCIVDKSTLKITLNGTSLKGNLVSAADEDWYYFDLSSKRYCTIKLSGNAPQGEKYFLYQFDSTKASKFTYIGSKSGVSNFQKTFLLEKGKYFIEVNSSFQSKYSINVESKPDLRIAPFTFLEKYFDEGKTYKAKFTIKNDGDYGIPSDKSFTIQLGTYTEDGSKVIRKWWGPIKTVSGGLGRGKSIEVPYTFTMPDLKDGGNYKVNFCVIVDKNHKVNEKNEDNNVTPTDVANSIRDKQ